MALPKSYLTSTKNLSAILNAIKIAKAPDKFTQKFLASLEFKSSSDRLIIGVFRDSGFLAEDGKPTNRYYDFLDQTQSDKILAEGIREAYSDLFAVNVNAHKMTRDEVSNKFRTLSEGQLSKAVLNKMATTFISLVKLADFKTPLKKEKPTKGKEEIEGKKEHLEEKPHEGRTVKLGGLVYNIQLILPESRDPAVYDALFRSLKEHLL